MLEINPNRRLRFLGFREIGVIEKGLLEGNALTAISLPLWITKFLFGRYFLVEMIADWIRQYHHIKEITLWPGGVVPVVRNILVAGGYPAVARDVEVRGLMATEVRGYVPRPTTFRLSQEVQIEAGAFAGRVGRFGGEDENLATVSLRFLGQMVQVQLPLGVLAVA